MSHMRVLLAYRYIVCPFSIKLHDTQEARLLDLPHPRPHHWTLVIVSGSKGSNADGAK
jgi:hypothetical protein